LDWVDVAMVVEEVEESVGIEISVYQISPGTQKAVLFR